MALKLNHLILFRMKYSRICWNNSAKIQICLKRQNWICWKKAMMWRLRDLKGRFKYENETRWRRWRSWFFPNVNFLDCFCFGDGIKYNSDSGSSCFSYYTSSVDLIIFGSSLFYWKICNFHSFWKQFEFLFWQYKKWQNWVFFPSVLEFMIL